MKKFGLLLASLLVLSGCAVEANNSTAVAESDESVAATSAPNDGASASAETVHATVYEEGCALFAAGELTHKYLELYRPMIEDICTDFEMRYDLIDLVLSPKVDRDYAQFYLDANVFGLSYWDRYAPNGVTPRRMLLLMEEEQDWWSEQLDELLIREPTWFGPSDEGGHCYAAVAESFCPKLYVANEGDTKEDFDVFTTMLGSRMDWSTFRKVVPIHDATHAFHTAIELTHWRYWLIEGQATYFELAASVLVPEQGFGNWRDDQLRQAFSQDEIKFTATTKEAAYEHFLACQRAKCEGLRYIGSSFAHELLVNSYGMDAYFAWNKDMAATLPPMNWRNFDQEKSDLGQKLFPELFEKHFGIDLEIWERDFYMPYLIENYRL
jgi:hypothetical protein